MARLEVWDPSTPPSTSSSSSAATCDTSESSDDDSAPVVSRTKRMNPGRRIISGRVYDSVLGVTCHWCRQKTVEDHVFCCRCNLAFCGGCLRNRNGEDIELEMKDDVEWTCPKCRGGCGPGCKNCCNCGPCRKVQGLEPTGLLVHTARARGFTNVHDYLIHQKTGDPEEIIAMRKQGKGWCQTDPSSFRKKQKRIEVENDVEATCRKRLNFTSSDNDLQVKRRDKSLQSNVSQSKEASPASSRSKDGMASQGGSLPNEDGSLKEPKCKVSRSLFTTVQPKPEPDLHIHEEPCQKREISLPGSPQPHLQGNAVQPKLEPDSHAPKEPRNMAAAATLGKATDVQWHTQCEMEMTFSPPSQHNTSPRTDASPPSLLRGERISHKSDAQQLSLVKLEPGLVDSQAKDGAHWNAFGTLRKVKMEEAYLCNGRSSSEQVKKERLDQPSQMMEETNVQFMRVKEEPQDQCPQPICDNVSTNKPNVFAAVFSRGEGDAAWCRFSEDFMIPSENVEGFTSTSTFLSCETPRNTGEVRALDIPSASNFHLYPEYSLPLSSRVKEEVILGKRVFRSNAAIKPESLSSQEAQWPVTNKVCKDRSMHAIQSPMSFPVCIVKEEPAAKSTMNASISTSLPGTTKVKTERVDFSFTIEPSVCPSISKSDRLPLGWFKDEVIDDMCVSKVICIDDDGALAVAEKDKPEMPAGLKKSTSLGSVSHLWKGDDFKNKLEAKLSEPFCREELDELTATASCRKPICRARETRQGCFQFMSKVEGLSYLDHHPELDWQLKQAISPIAKLSLLRGFFFWLEHASTHGAFKPWTLVSRSPEVLENDECIEIEGPDCEIVAVVCSVDEEVNEEHKSRMMKNSSIIS